MPKMLVRPNLSYKSLIMEAKDFVTFTEIIERSMIVDSGYKNDTSYWILEEDRGLPEATMFKGKVISRKEYDAIPKQED